MENGRARQFQPVTPADQEQYCNIVELTTRKQLRQKINQLLLQCQDSSVTTREMREELRQAARTFGNEFAIQLVRALQRDDDTERQSIIWLLTVLNAGETIPPLQQMATRQSLPRAIRLAAALALAGMGVTAEIIAQDRHVRLYVLS